MVVELLPRLWRRAAGPFTPLAEEAAGWADRMPENWEQAGRPYERRLVDAALDLLAGLIDSQGEQVLVNQDLHAGNVLRATREPWLVIDPKPLLGEREFAVVPMVRGAELGHSPEAVRHGWTGSARELGLDRERVGAGRSRTDAGLEPRTATRSSPTRSRWPAGWSTATETVARPPTGPGDAGQDWQVGHQ